jgi:hydrogenase maturation protease
MQPTSERRIIGIGSHFGDDQIGWLLTSRLRTRARLAVDVLAVETPLQLLDVIGGCRQLVIIDACLTGASVGTITRYDWPDPRIESRCTGSTHQLGVVETLQLGQQLGRLPKRVTLFGIEIGNSQPALSVYSRLEEVLPDLERRIGVELDDLNMSP